MGYVIATLFSALLYCATTNAAEPYAIQTWGNFKQMAHSRNTRGVVKLSELGDAKGTYGLGAIAGLRGEVLQWDGNLRVSRGDAPKGETSEPTAVDEAVLFIRATVHAWQPVAVGHDMTQKEFEVFVLASARRLGLDTSRAFPFTVHSDALALVWHVVTGAAPAGGHHGGGKHNEGHAQARVFRESVAAGMLLGFHTGAELEGIASHPGERFHVHYTSKDLSVSGHVDEYRVRKGAVLMLPSQ